MKRILPFLFIVFIWLFFSSPYFFAGKVPLASTYQVTNFSPWSMYNQFGQPVKNGAMPDVITQIYPWRHLVMNLWKSGEIPLWNMYSFGGTPLLANYQSAVLSPFNILFFVLPFIDGWGLLVLLQPLLAGIGMYLFARRVGVSRGGGLLSAISFMFCGFLVVWMGYATLGYALLFLPYALTGLEGFFITQKMRYLFLLAFAIPLSFFSGHFQISLYVLLIASLYWGWKSLQYRSFHLAISSGVYLLGGLLLCLPQVLPSLEFYTQSLRSGLFQKGEVIPLGYLPTILAPDFLGNPVTRNDWFGHYAEWNTYIGVIPFFLALFSVSAWKKPIVKFALLTGITCFLLALDTPIADIFVALHIPVLSTSALSRIVSIYSFFFALLSGFGWDSLSQYLQSHKKKGLWMLIAGVTVLFGVLWIVVARKIFLPVEKVGIAKQNLILPSAFAISLVLAVLAGFFGNRKIKQLLLFLLIGITAFDMYRFASKWQAFDPKVLVTPNVPVVLEFKKIQGYERAVGNYSAEVSNFYQLPSLDGYDALYPKRFGEFMSYAADGYVHEADRSVVTFPKDGMYTASVINLLNAEYIIHKVADTNKTWTFPYWKYPASQFSMIFSDGVYQIYKNNAAYPHAFLVGNYKVVQNPQKNLDMLFKTINPRDTVTLEERPSLTISEDKKAYSSIKKYSANRVSIQTSAATNMLLFLSDTFYPGWKAFVDGKETKVLRADYAFRAVEVPSGRHTVVFSYQPASFVVALLIAGVGLLGMIGGIFTVKRWR